jgi:phage tail sheath gpL-like
MEFAAEVAGIVALYGAADPARPFQTLAMSRALGTPETDHVVVRTSGTCCCSTASRRRSASPAAACSSSGSSRRTRRARRARPDTAYLDATTMLTLMYLRYSFRVRMQTGTRATSSRTMASAVSAPGRP